jgi:hypothetical protein
VLIHLCLRAIAQLNLQQQQQQQQLLVQLATVGVWHVEQEELLLLLLLVVHECLQPFAAAFTLIPHS